MRLRGRLYTEPVPQHRIDPRDIEIRSITADDWAGFREIRLRMLADEPIAFEERLVDAQTVPEYRWRDRAGRSLGFVRFAALEPGTGRWVATMGATLAPQPDRCILIGVYVEPAARGAGGVTDLLLDTVQDWSRVRRPLMSLFVHEDNARARRAYEKRGFVLTGSSEPYPLDPRRVELEMIKRL
jgi:RimJ/RimL family protein N-acetyltransferase